MASERRTNILEAATGVFAAHTATMPRPFGTSPPLPESPSPFSTITFGSKQDLYIRVIESVRNELTAATAAVMEQAAPVEVRMRTAIDRFLSYVEARPAAAKVLFTAPEGDLSRIPG